MADLDLSGFFAAILTAAILAKDERQRAGRSADDVLRLTVALSRYLNPVKFNVGDFITPVAGYGVNGAGKPHIVVEINPYSEPCFAAGEVGTTTYGLRPDLRVLEIRGDFVASFWVESWRYDPWVSLAPATTGQSADDASAVEGAATVVDPADPVPHLADIAKNRPAADAASDRQASPSLLPWAGSLAPETGEPERAEGATS
jgi:hypothetical protein